MAESNENNNTLSSTLTVGSGTTGGTGQEPTFTVNGSAINTATHAYTVTPDAQLQHGSVMSDVRVDLSKTFDMTFDINVGNNDNGADGMGFVLHNDPLGHQALGDIGGSLGMMGINNGVGIEFDTYQNTVPNDIANDHTNFDNTMGGNNTALSPATDLGNIEDGQWHQVHVVSDGQTISYTFDGVQMSSLSLATVESYLTSQYAYFGFTGGTGGLSEQEQVRLDALTATTENGTLLQTGGAAGSQLGSTSSQLVQAMAGFGGNSDAADSLSQVPLGADTSQTTFVTTPRA
jgi:Bacterial lectin